MGVVNVTPDSFSDGGRHFEAGSAIDRGLALHADGADIVDVGGESTRPGAARIDVEEELRRVVPVIRELSAAGVTVSIDTMRSATAAGALDAGAAIVNDVSGGLADPKLLDVVADAGVPYVAMHWRGPSADMQSRASYGDVVAEVCDELARRLTAIDAAGIKRDLVVLDPGLGFAKTATHNWELLAHLDRLATLGRPILVGASRKSFLGSLLADGDQPRDSDHREDATVAITALAANAGAWAVRVHEARPSADAVRVVAAIGAAR
ncbi:MAG: dihydropteroate synthase [Frankiaceae bacterium]|nr:dihydropteroate synthase [Frankiaceae bacterium]